MVEIKLKIDFVTISRLEILRKYQDPVFSSSYLPQNMKKHLRFLFDTQTYDFDHSMSKLENVDILQQKAFCLIS